MNGRENENSTWGGCSAYQKGRRVGRQRVVVSIVGYRTWYGQTADGDGWESGLGGFCGGVLQRVLGNVLASGLW